LRARLSAAETGARYADASRQDLLDEIYYLRDVAGAREQRANRLEARVEALQGELKALRRAVQRTPPTASVAADETQAISGVGMPRDPAPRLFVDISELALREGRTGVQRVVREIVLAMLASPPDGFIVELVCARPGQPYRCARAFAAKLKGEMAVLPDAMVEFRATDVFLGLDHSMQSVIDHGETFRAMRKKGVQVWFECNDTLPLSRPEWFPEEVQQTFMRWFRTVAGVADGIACISRTTEGEVRRWLHELAVPRAAPPMLVHFPLGADIDRDGPPAVLTAKERSELERLPDMPTFLMVGTIEPRKGHAQALEAFNLLWQRGESMALVLVGFTGWMTQVLQRRIRYHDELGTRLYWFVGASDALLHQLYASCTALLAPSEGEGFGLPLVEAAAHGLPILCRDLPVFREVAGAHATYFEGLDGQSLATAICDWIDASRRGAAPASGGIRRSTWTESARELLRVVLDSQPDTPMAAGREGGVSEKCAPYPQPDSH
jgi:glycosyltransferase involved in cell wall biosynthesis